MKKFFVLIAALLMAAACTAPPTNREVTTNTNMTPEKAAAPAITEAEAFAKEKAIWETIKVKDYDAFAGMMAEDSIEVTSSEGNLTKAGSVSMVKDFEPSEITFSDWKFLTIDKDAWIVTYTVNVKGKYKGKDFPPATARGSSAWAWRDAKWVAVYHQECDASKTPAPPTAAPKSTASPATTPAAFTASSDVVANEKAVWDFLKNKQYDAFADQLSPDSIEVEPNGVFDKAGTLAGVKTFDFSKSTLSDFKTLSIDEDAALVTYVVTNAGAKPEKERHTTIWVNRSGKWVALLHHGTPVTPSMSGTSPATPTKSPAMSPSMTHSPSPK